MTSTHAEESFYYQKSASVRLPDGYGHISFTHARSKFSVNQLHGPFTTGSYEIFMLLDGSANILINDRIYNP
jgi:hypothetical protein